MRVSVRLALFALTSVAAGLCAVRSSAQVSYGGTPPSTWANLQLPLQVLEVPQVDVAAQAAQRDVRRPGEPLYYGVVVPLALSAEETGVWEMLPGGDLVWRVALRSPGALSLSAVFSAFQVPPGAQLFVHGGNGARTLGAYIDENANLDGSFAFEPLAGDEIVIEYLEPAGAAFHARLVLGDLIHDFKGVFSLMAGAGQTSPGIAAAAACEIDVNCPEGANWQDEKRAVVRLLSNGALCTGAMLNNTASNGTRYLMTAFHCGNMNNAVIYFNYERPNCGSGSAPIQTVSGTTQKAGNKTYDYRLVQVTPAIPAAYNHYLLGWNRTTTAPSNTVCIHHPAGDVKKISFDNHPPVIYFQFWNILQWDAGVTEPGSSGSPLMNPSGQFIGQLYGGSSYCNTPFDDIYGRLDLAWAKVKPFLDPLSTGATSIGGFDP
jgi:lysyl endopeptidase